MLKTRVIIPKGQLLVSYPCTGTFIFAVACRGEAEVQARENQSLLLLGWSMAKYSRSENFVC
jgi:hypothetical protein